MPRPKKYQLKLPDIDLLSELFKAGVDRLKDHRTVSGHINTRIGFLLAALGAFLGLGSRTPFARLMVLHYEWQTWCLAISLGFAGVGLLVGLWGIFVQGPRVFDPGEFSEEFGVPDLLVDKRSFYQAAFVYIAHWTSENEKRINFKASISKLCIVLVGVSFVLSGIGAGSIAYDILKRDPSKLDRLFERGGKDGNTTDGAKEQNQRNPGSANSKDSERVRSDQANDGKGIKPDADRSKPASS